MIKPTHARTSKLDNFGSLLSDIAHIHCACFRFFFRGTIYLFWLRWSFYVVLNGEFWTWPFCIVHDKHSGWFIITSIHYFEYFKYQVEACTCEESPCIFAKRFSGWTFLIAAHTFSHLEHVLLWTYHGHYCQCCERKIIASRWNTNATTKRT